MFRLCFDYLDEFCDIKKSRVISIKGCNSTIFIRTDSDDATPMIAIKAPNYVKDLISEYKVMMGKNIDLKIALDDVKTELAELRKKAGKKVCKHIV